MKRIIGLGLGKYNSTACTLVCADGEVRFQTLLTTTARLRELFDDEQPDLVVFEASAREVGVRQAAASPRVAVAIAARPPAAATPPVTSADDSSSWAARRATRPRLPRTIPSPATRRPRKRLPTPAHPLRAMLATESPSGRSLPSSETLHSWQPPTLRADHFPRLQLSTVRGKDYGKAYTKSDRVRRICVLHRRPSRPGSPQILGF